MLQYSYSQLVKIDCPYWALGTGQSICECAVCFHVEFFQSQNILNYVCLFMGEPTVLLYCTVDADVFEESKDYKYRETIILEEKM